MTTSQLPCASCGATNPAQAHFCGRCGVKLHVRRPEAANAHLALLPPDYLLNQRYRILAHIGTGGYADVYQAIDTRIASRRVAVKEMRLRGFSEKQVAAATRAFKREALMLADLRHPNLPGIFDYFTEDGRLYLVMSFIEGESLEAYLMRQPDKRLLADEVLQIAIQLCSVLDYLHTHKPPIIFRDLKPANIMRTPEGQLYLIDFGIARHFKPGQSRDTAALGSPGYAAPEQYGKAQSTPQTDIYSLGATLHCLLSGIDPSHAPFTHTRLDLPNHRELSLLISYMLDIDARRRPTSVAAIKQTLLYIASARSVHKHSAPPRSYSAQDAAQKPPAAGPQPAAGSGAQQQQIQLQKPSSSPRRGLSRRGMITGAALALGGGLLTWYLGTREPAHSSSPRSPNTRTSSSATLAQSVPAADPALFSPAALLTVAWSPDNSRIACGSREGLVTIMNAGNQQPILTYRGHVSNNAPATSNSVSAVAWSLDGEFIASASYDTTVQLWTARGGKRFDTYREHISPVLALAWSPDGKYIASADQEHEIHIWDYFNNTIVAKDTQQHTQQVTSLAWSPDGKYLASGSADRTVRIWDASTMRPLYTYLRHSDVVEAVTWSPDSQRIASASDDHTVQIWDALTGRYILSYEHHTDRVWTVSWSPDGKRIASGSWDRTAQVWNAMNGGQPFSYNNHTGYVLSVMWSPDGKRIVSGDADGNLQVWIPGALPPRKGNRGL